METVRTRSAQRGHHGGRRHRGGPALAFILALALGAGLGAARAHAQASPPLDSGFPSLSLSYSDAQGPGSVTITPQGPDAATGGTAVDVTIAQAVGEFGGAGFVRGIEPRVYVIAAILAGERGEAYFFSGTLTRDDEGVRWRGHGRWSAISDPAVSGEWHMAEWPVIQPPQRPQLSTDVRIEPVGGSRAGGTVTLAASPDGETRFAAELSGLTAGLKYALRLHAGTPTSPSASFTDLATMTADGSGRVMASGLARFRETGAIRLLDIADGGHFLAITDAGRTVAVGTIPALEPLG